MPGGWRVQPSVNAEMARDHTHEREAPLGEPSPMDRLPSLKVLKPRKPDVYCVVGVSPEAVKMLRPRWSINRCRRWLKKQEANIVSAMQDALERRIQQTISGTTGPTLHRDSRMRDSSRNPHNRYMVGRPADEAIEGMAEYGPEGLGTPFVLDPDWTWGMTETQQPTTDEPDPGDGLRYYDEEGNPLEHPQPIAPQAVISSQAAEILRQFSPGGMYRNGPTSNSS